MSEEEIENYITDSIPFLKQNFDTEEDFNWVVNYIRSTLKKKN